MTYAVPKDFEKYAATENDRELEDRFGVSIKVIKRLRGAISIPSPAKRVIMALPEDFGDHLDMQNIDLASKYHVGEKVIRRFRREFAIKSL